MPEQEAQTERMEVINGRLHFRCDACGTEFSVSAENPPLIASCPGNRCDGAWWIERRAVKEEKPAKPERF